MKNDEWNSCWLEWLFVNSKNKFWSFLVTLSEKEILVKGVKSLYYSAFLC